jgi:CheY-like chemotaxis protein
VIPDVPAPSGDENFDSAIGERILVVEDEPNVRGMVRRTLEGRGYTVHVAEDGAAALDILQQDAPIDLVLTDWIMPRLGGAALVDELNGLTNSPRVLVMTGYAHQSFRGGAPRCDLPLIEKPFTGAQITRRVREVLDAARGGRATAS